MEIRFSVNELSKLVGVSSRNIRYYDQIGLFPCSGFLENGYRFYTIDKIEEINLIHYLRKMGIPINEIKEHMQKREMGTYKTILNNHLHKVNQELENLQKIQHHMQRRIATLEYVSKLPPMGKIHIQNLLQRKVIQVNDQLHSQLDWERALQKIVAANQLPYGVFVGDIGFIVDLKTVNSREADEFMGIYLLLDAQDQVEASKEMILEKGDWLTIYVRGGHEEAKQCYKRLLSYASEKDLKLGKFATERMLIDQYISRDENDHITEIMIPIIG